MSLILSGTDGLSDIDGSATTPAIRGTDANTGIFFPATDTIAFSEGGAEAMRIDSSGNVGIGTSSPDSSNKLQVAGDIGLSWATDKFIGMKFGAGASYKMGLMLKDVTRECKVWSQSSDSDDKITFYTGSTPSERIRIDTSGNLFVGTTSNFSADKMCLNFTSAQNGLGIRDDSNSSGAYYAVFRNSANGIIGSITRVTTTNAVTYNTTSDQRLKSNIADASPVLDKLMAVKVRQFDWTEGNLHQDAGFIAQELASVLSGIVTEGKNEDDLWQLDYARLTPYLVKAMQEQQAIITGQQTMLASLTARIEALEQA